MTQQIVSVFGASPFVVVFALSVHLHLHLISRRLTRVETTPTVKRELSAQHTR